MLNKTSVLAFQPNSFNKEQTNTLDKPGSESSICWNGLWGTLPSYVPVIGKAIQSVK